MTQFLQHVTGNKSIKSNLGEQILNDVKDSPGYKAVLEAMKALHERNRQRYQAGEGALQLYAVKELEEMGWYGVDPKEALSFYMKEMYRGGEGSLQLWAVKECKRLGLGDVDPHQAFSILMKHKYENGQGPLQQWWQQMCKEKGYLIAGKVPSSKEAKRVYEEHEAFNRHWPKIQSYARDGNNYETLEDGKEVFVVPRRSESYIYLTTLRRADDDDWRLKLLREAGINMDRYKEAREKKNQDFVEEKYEKSKKARSDNKFTVDEDSDSDEDL